ncbi:hypothetical protein MVEN_01336900 [Mycena venus]|uniref:Ubiquitin-like protease family profile domain-containing protein n=1 Tax=Mycena venus TaxID=2733690 RepID=A0A8H6Y0T9_9AGAR|nr:hypothetical protein MVEN_01336900 [Mycena venus]
MTPLFRGIYLPHPKLSVLELAIFSLPPVVVTAADYQIPPGHNFFSQNGDHSDLDLLMEIKVPPPTVISSLIAEARQQYLDGAESICIPWTGHVYPLWVLDMWSELQLVVKPNVDAWARAIKWLKRLELKGYHLQVKETLRVLETLAWTGKIPLDALKGDRATVSNDPVDSLTRYLSREWFSSQHMDQMLDLLLYDIQKKKTPTQGIQMMTTAITTEILVQYRKNPRDYDPNGTRFLQRFGATLENDSEFAGIFHVNENHWVAAAVDVLDKSVEFGDPAGEEDVDVCAALQWFLRQHLPNSVNTLSPIELACTRQRDGHNCGLYAPNAIGHRFLPDKYPLFSSDILLGDLGRLEMLRRVIVKFHESQGPSVQAAPAIIAQRMHEFMNGKTLRRSRSPSPPRTPPPTDPLSNALGQLSVSPKKPNRKRRKVDNPDSDSDDDSTRRVMAPIFKTKPKPKPIGKRAVDKKATRKPPAAQVKREQRIQALRLHEDAALEAMPEDMSDNEQVTSGRPRSEVMDHLTVEIKSTDSVRAYRCAAPGCIKTFHPRTLARVLAHSKRCLKLTEEQRRYASQHSAATSPGARAEELAKGLSADQLKPPPPPVEFFGQAAAQQVRAHHSAQLDLSIVKLFAAAGLPPRLADYPEWKDTLHLAALAGPRYIPCWSYHPHGQSYHEHVSVFRLTGEMRAVGENFYTVHASTPEGRSFLLEGVECTLVSHTAEWMADMVISVMGTVGIERFVAASSDNTGNTRGCRRLICEKVPTILNLPDPNHHLNNTLKDILKIPFFKLTIKIVRTTVKTFSQSKQSKAMLKQLRLLHSTGRGLETVGKTRFATIPKSAISLRRNLDPVRTLSTNGQVEIKASWIDSSQRYSQKTLDFQIKLSQLIAVTEGAAKAIQCLEAASCNPADVYLLWLAVTAHVRAALAESLLPEDVCNEIRGIINYRWKEFFVTNPGHGAYLAAFYLNPKYLNSSIFKHPNAVAPPTITIPGTRNSPEVPIGVQNAKTFFTVAEYLYQLGITEVEHGADPVLVAFKKKKRVFADKFKSQFTAYAQGAFPFNTPIADRHPIHWWKVLEGSEHGGIVASLALKLYSAIPHSMADERTMSVITWQNPALRNLEKVNTIISFAQIRGWYRDQAKQKALAQGTTKSRAGARPYPEVKFYNIQRDILGADSDDRDDDKELEEEDVDEIIESDDEFDAAVAAGAGVDPNLKVDWLDEPRHVVPSSRSLDLDSLESEVNLESVLLQDILADQPVLESDVSAVDLDHGYTAMDQEADDNDDETFDELKWS